MSFGISEVAGWTRLSLSGVVGDSGKPVDIVGYTISSGGTKGIVTFKNGTSATAPAAWQEQATTINQEVSDFLAYPIRMDQGCYASFDGNVTAATIFYRQILT